MEPYKILPDCGNPMVESTLMVFELSVFRIADTTFVDGVTLNSST